MKTVLAHHRESAYALLRIVVGFSFLCHGVIAVAALLGEGTPYSPAWLYNTAGIVEFVTGALVLVGYRTELAAFLASGQMAVAYFYRHQPTACSPSRTRASWRCSTASCSSSSRPPGPGSGAWTPAAHPARTADERRPRRRRIPTWPG